MANPQLTPVLTINTTVPAPVSALQSDGSFKIQASTDAFVSLKICSEFTSFTAPVTPFGGVSQLALVQDKDGQPMIFSIGNDNQLYCLRHIPGGHQTWQSYMISPVTTTGCTVLVYDVSQAITATTNTIVLAAVSVNSNQTQTLYTAVVNLDLFDPNSIQWVPRSTAVAAGTLEISSISCGGSTPAGQGIIILGTSATSGLLSDSYTIPAISDGTDPATVPPPQVYQSILQVAPGNLQAGFFQGSFTLFKMANGTVGGCFSNLSNSLTVQLDFDGLGVVHNMFPCPASNGFTDLFVASDNGVAFFSSSQPDIAPQVVLPSIGFRQVVASQSSSTLAVLAVSTVNELYYIEGTRANPHSSIITWLASGLPIRTDVREISTQYNLSAGSTELIYVTNADTTVKHLYRTPESFVWQETVIAVKPAAQGPQSLTYAAQVTTIQPINSVTGVPIGPQYPVTLACDWAYVSVNTGTYTLNNKTPTNVVTDTSGTIHIIQRMSDSIASPSYTVGLTQFGQTTVSVDPAQRISTQLPKYTTAASLTNAITTNGQPVKFPTTTNFDAAATVLSQYQPILDKVNQNTTKSNSPLPLHLAVERVATDPSTTISFSQTDDGSIVQDDGSWISNAATDIADFFGDVWECVKSVVSAAFKFALQILDEGISIYIFIEGKLFRFALSTLFGALRSFAGFLKFALGIDITGFLNWLGFIFDIDKLLQTQASVNSAVKAGVDFVGYSLQALQPAIAQLFNTIKSDIQQWIPDDRAGDTPQGSQPGFFTKLLSFIFDNPIIKLLGHFNPMNWVMNQVDDIFGDSFQLPDLTVLFDAVMEAVGSVFSQEASNILGLLTDVINKFTAVFDGRTNIFVALGEVLGDAFWTFFDAFEIIIKDAVAAVPSILTAFWNVLTSPIQLPIISTLWEVFMGSGTPLTFLNAITIIPSWALNIYAGTVYGKMPFDKDVFGDPTQWIPSQDQVTSWLQPRSTSSSLHKKAMADPHLSVVRPRNDVKTSTSSIPSESSTTTNDPGPTPSGEAHIPDFPGTSDANDRPSVDPLSVPTTEHSSNGSVPIIELVSTSAPDPASKPANDPSPTPPTATGLSDWQKADLILSIACPTVTCLSTFIDLACIVSNAHEAQNVQARPNPDAQTILNDNEMGVWQPLLGNFDNGGNGGGQPQAWSPFKKVLSIIRGLVAGFVVFCCSINFIVAITHDDREWTSVWQYKARLFGLIFQLARLLNICWPDVVWPGYIADIGSILQYGVGCVFSGNTPLDAEALTSATLSSLSAALCMLARVFGEAPEAAAVAWLALGFDAANAVACIIIWNLSTSSSNSAHTDKATRAPLTNAAAVKDSLSCYKLPPHLDGVFYQLKPF